MTAHDNYLDPDHWLGDEDRAYEVEIEGVWFAWDEDDNVYRQCPTDPTARDDGYVLIGKLELPHPDADPEEVFKQFCRDLLEEGRS
jgi:hypothetical protein